MRKFRQTYYDKFSRFYDYFIALHASDRQGSLRQYLVERTRVKPGDYVMDLCTGTGSLLAHVAQRVGPRGMVVGIDFSTGMLRMAREKTGRYDRVFLVQADAGHLPLKTAVFDAATCSYAFYELKGDRQDKCLMEIIRILKSDGPFFMMEHDMPDQPVLRLLFFIRFLSMGARRALHILKHEHAYLKRFFKHVKKLKTPSGRSKILVCRSTMSS